MCFIDYHTRITSKIWFGENLSQKHTISHVLDNSLWVCAVFEANRVTHFMTELHIHFVSDSCCNAHAGDTEQTRES